jgi:hypothetical protein
MSEYEPRQHKPKPQQTTARADTVAVKPKRQRAMVTAYRTYCFYTIQHRDDLLVWNRAARHEGRPEPKRLDELERPLRHIRYMQLALEKRARQVFEESR